MSQLSIKRQLLFFSNLSSLYKAGIPITQGLTHLREQVHDRQVLELIVVLEDAMLRRSLPLTEALRAMPGVFPPLVMALLEQGELAGKLDVCFARIVELLEKRQKRMKEVVKALAYPVFVATCAILLVPIPKAFQSGSVFVYFQQLAIPAGILFALWLGVKYFARTLRTNGAFRYRAHKALLNIPKIGLLMRKLVLARFCSALSMMLNAGLPAAQAVSVAGRATENDYVMLTIGASVDNIRNGGSLADSLRLSAAFPPSFAGMVAAGEATGDTSVQLDRLAAMYESEADTVIQLLMNVLGPLVLFLVVGLVALQVIGFYMQQWDNLEKVYKSL